MSGIDPSQVRRPPEEDYVELRLLGVRVTNVVRVAGIVSRYQLSVCLFRLFRPLVSLRRLWPSALARVEWESAPGIGPDLG